VASATTGHKEVTWVNNGTIRVIMYRLSSRTENAPDTRGVTEQRWEVISQTGLEKDARIMIDADSWVIDTTPNEVKFNGVVVAYECEAVRELLLTGAPVTSPIPPGVATGDLYDYTHEDYSYLVWVDNSRYYARNGSTGVVTSDASASTLINALITELGTLTTPSTIKIKGAITVDATIAVKDYIVLDLRGAKLTAKINLNSNMIETMGTGFSIIGGLIDGNKLNQSSGNCIRILGTSQRFWAGYGMKIVNAYAIGIYCEGTGVADQVGVGTFSDIDIEDGGSHGFLTSAWSGDHIIMGCNAGGNGGSGFAASSSNSNIFSGNISWNNGNRGIDIYACDVNTVIGNRVDWNTGWGIVVDGASSDNNLVMGNEVYSNVAGQIYDGGTGTKITNNPGYITENSGNATLLNGQTHVHVTHGCSYTPSAKDVSIVFTEQPTNATTYWYVGDFTATEFQLHANDPGASNLDFSWSVRKTP
jgi:parallel beta-helix repeat protein